MSHRGGGRTPHPSPGPRRRRPWATLAAIGAIALIPAGLSGCGGDDGDESPSGGVGETQTEVVVQAADGGEFDAAGIYEKAAPAVVTVLSIFGESADPIGGGAGQGSGFAISTEGEILTNAHVVTSGGAGNGGGQPRPANQVFVEFGDRNRLSAEIVGFDPDADLALIEVDPERLELKPLELSDREEYSVGEPVAAIGSPFGEEQSLSLGIISATDRTIQSLTQFSVDNAIQTDASINPGNSGGPLIDGSGNVIGINQQIESASGTNSGVGFAIPATAIRYSLEQLREEGDVEYGYLGVTTQPIWPQLAEELGLDTDTGALISEVVPGGPADEAGLEGSSDQQSFQGAQIETGGDVIVAVDGHKLVDPSDLAELVARRRPGEAVMLEVLRGDERDEVEVTLKPRPERVNSPG
ncbi:MAG: S1C family serine protease [Solirubrobacterales bacterium]